MLTATTLNTCHHFLSGNILTRLFNEPLHLISFMVLASQRGHTLLHRTSSRHTMCLPRKLSRKNFCPPRYVKYFVLKALNLTLENLSLYPHLAGQSPVDYAMLEPFPAGCRWGRLELGLALVSILLAILFKFCVCVWNQKSLFQGLSPWCLFFSFIFILILYWSIVD